MSTLLATLLEAHRRPRGVCTCLTPRSRFYYYYYYYNTRPASSHSIPPPPFYIILYLFLCVLDVRVYTAVPGDRFEMKT